MKKRLKTVKAEKPITLQMSETITMEHFQTLLKTCNFHDIAGKTHILKFKRLSDPSKIVTLKFDVVSNGVKLINAKSISNIDMQNMYSILTPEVKERVGVPEKEEVDPE